VRLVVEVRERVADLDLEIAREQERRVRVRVGLAGE
jgi:hypothetical protein